jgi:bifunctional enzyme CysN/CysC
VSRQPKPANVISVAHRITAAARQARNRHRAGILWFTGLPGSGKSTLAVALEQKLFEAGAQTYLLDGDNIRQGLSSDLGFSPEDRAENIRRIGELAALFADAGLVVITAFISPYRADRAEARRAGGPAFHEIFIKAPLTICEARDPKGHYRRARAGEIADFTGVSAPYEEPEAADLVIETDRYSVEQSVALLMDFVRARLMAG